MGGWKTVDGKLILDKNKEKKCTNLFSSNFGLEVLFLILLYEFILNDVKFL